MEQFKVIGILQKEISTADYDKTDIIINLPYISPINRSNPLRILGPSASDIKIFRFFEKPSETICIMKLTDLMLQKLQIALHLELFKYVSQVLSKNHMNFECKFSQLPLLQRYTLLMPIVPDRVRIFFTGHTWIIICTHSS